MAMNDVDWANIFAALGGSAPAGPQQQHPQPLTSPSSEHGEWPAAAAAAGVRHTHSTSSSFSIAHDPPRGIGTSDVDLGFYWPQSTHHGAHPPPHPHHQGGEWPSAPGSTSSSTAAANPAPPPPPPTTPAAPAATRASARTRTRSAASNSASTGSGSNTPPGLTPALTPIAPAPPGNSRRGSTVNTPAVEEEDVEDKRVRNTLACELTYPRFHMDHIPSVVCAQSS